MHRIASCCHLFAHMISPCTVHTLPFHLCVILCSFFLVWAVFTIDGMSQSCYLQTMVAVIETPAVLWEVAILCCIWVTAVCLFQVESIPTTCPINCAGCLSVCERYSHVLQDVDFCSACNCQFVRRMELLVGLPCLRSGWAWAGPTAIWWQGMSLKKTNFMMNSVDPISRHCLPAFAQRCSLGQLPSEFDVTFNYMCAISNALRRQWGKSCLASVWPLSLGLFRWFSFIQLFISMNVQYGNVLYQLFDVIFQFGTVRYQNWM